MDSSKNNNNKKTKMTTLHKFESEIPLPPPVSPPVKRESVPRPANDGGAKRREEMAALLERGDYSFLEFDIPLAPTSTNTSQKKKESSTPDLTLVVGG